MYSYVGRRQASKGPRKCPLAEWKGIPTPPHSALLVAPLRGEHIYYSQGETGNSGLIAFQVRRSLACWHFAMDRVWHHEWDGYIVYKGRWRMGREGEYAWGEA